MTTIHMETEKVRTVARKLDTDAAQMLSSLSQTRSSASRLRFAWQGGGAEDFNNELNRLIKNIENQVVALQNLSVRVSREVDEWEGADQLRVSDGSSTWTRTMPLSKGKSINDHPFDWRDWWFDFMGTGKETVNALSKVPYDSLTRVSYKGIGRFLNFLAGNAHAGWVGKMDDLGHLIKSPAVQKMLPLIGYGLGVWEDRSQGDDWGRALGSEAIDAALGLIPFVGVYNIALGLANLSGGGLEILGFHEQAVFIQDWTNKLDITEKLGDAIYDFVTEHPTSTMMSIVSPTTVWLDPNYIRFGGTFWGDTLKDVGLESAANWIYNSTETYASFEEHFYSQAVDFAQAKWSEIFH